MFLLPAGIELDHPGMGPPLQGGMEIVSIQDHHLGFKQVNINW